jgi:hypothetical protein
VGANRSFSVPSFAAFEEASPGPAPAGGANTPNPSPVASKRGSRTPGPKKPSTPLGHNPDESRKSAPRRLFGRKDNATAAAAVAAAGKADDEAKAKQQPGKRDASPVKVGLFASLLRKKEAQEKSVEAEEGEKKEDDEEGSKPVGEEANEAKQNKEDADEKERKQSQPFPGIPLATDSMDDFAKKQNSRENAAVDDGVDAPAEAGDVEQAQQEESDSKDNEEDEPAEDGGDDGDGTAEPAAEEAAEEPEGTEEPGAADDGDDGKEADAAPVTLAELDRKNSAEVIREATERRERRTRARNRRMQGRVRTKAGAAGTTAKPKPGSRKAAATDAGR